MSSYTPAVIDEGRLVDLALRLVRTPSPSGGEGDVAAIVREELEELGFDVRVDALGSVVGTLDAGPGPCVMLDSHMDTVGVGLREAWTFDPAGELADGRLYGRGATDMKGPLAAAIYGAAAVRDRLRRGRVVISASVGEELLEGPATELIARAVRPEAVVICEPSGQQVAIGQRGRAEVQVALTGIPAHSSRPDLAVSAAEAMADVVTRLRDLALPDSHRGLKPAILVLTEVASTPSPSLSVVPDGCRAIYDRRTLPDETEDEILEPIRAVIDEVIRAYDGAEGVVAISERRFESYTGELLRAPVFAPGWWVGQDAPIVRVARSGLRAAGLPDTVTAWDFCTNGSGTAGHMRLPTIGYGPGRPEVAHMIDEHLETTDLVLGAAGYSAIIEALCQQVETLSKTDNHAKGKHGRNRRRH